MASINEGNRPNREELLQMAIQAAKANQKSGARVMLRKILHEDKRNERAMMWMAKLARNEKERQYWLNQVLTVNPDNDIARNKLEDMDYQKSARNNRMMLTIGLVVGIVIIVLVAILLLLAAA